MLKRLNTSTIELQLLLASTRIYPSAEGDAVVRQLLTEGVDWARFVWKAVDHGLANLAGQTLARVAPDVVPEEILDAFRKSIDQTRISNTAVFEELAGVIQALVAAGIDAIPFKGPTLAIQAYGDLGLRVFGDLDFLIRDGDVPAAITTLHSLGYERTRELTSTQLDIIHRLQGQEVIFKQGTGNIVEPHTRLTPIKMAIDIDYAGLWRRASRTKLNGRPMLTLAPDDNLLVLAIHGGKELWWNIKWAADFATFVESRSDLNWTVIAERARVQGCLRMLLLATSLARRYFYATVPEEIVAAERADPVIELMIGRIMAHWQADKPAGPPSNKTLSLDRLWLHDGTLRRVRYAMRTAFLPGPHHIASIPLPRALSFVYVPIKIVHDFLALPLWRASLQIFAQTGRWREALAGIDLPLSLMLASTETKSRIRRHRKARDDAQRLLVANPNNASTWRALGDALFGLKRYSRAIDCYDKALRYDPDDLGIWKARGEAMRSIGKMADLPEFARNPQDASAWAVRAGRLSGLNRFAEAIEATDRALTLDPSHVAATRIGIYSRLHSQDWRRREDDKRRIAEGLKDRQRVIVPLFHRAICDSEADALLVAQLWTKGLQRPMKPLCMGERYRHDKIRVAYMSTDFRDHVVSDAIVGCFEHHDKSRFEITAVSLHPSDGSDVRRRIDAAVDRCVDADTLSDAEVATILRGLEIDIFIDLNGNTGAKRTSILARRPAPIQVNYLGYPGTMGVPFMDYIIADHTLIPDENQIYYSEKVAYLPHTYMPTDGKRRISERTLTRAEAGLPESGFVFSCFNRTHKIGPEIFAVWMRLLHTVQGSVLWLKSMNPEAMKNLQREAKDAGVAPERLVFAPRMAETADHLARLRLADLFLDTLPYNAHATTGDALWAGLPVLTCLGKTFSGRVAAGLLQAVGLPELVTTSLDEYEELARSLAHHPARLAAIKAKLERNRDIEPLFDTARFTRNLEAAYRVMWERHEADLPPAHFSVVDEPCP